ncbi:MAG: lipoprotein, RlpA family [Candidatus Binatia bacterium]|nr:MAG: lipoprotein, RlpA family [Candidatus Binatia bacterium]
MTMPTRASGWLVVGVAFVAGACGWFRSRPPIEPRVGASQQGVASWYGPRFHGNPTASGEVFDQYDLTAAHPTLPLGTRVLVTNLENGRQVEVRVNDRGPFVRGRVIDLSYAAARALGMTRPGTAQVRVEVIGFGQVYPEHAPYAVQVGAFADRRRAEELRRVLRPMFADTRVQAWRVNGRTYYRVRLGRFKRHEEARAQALKVQRYGVVPVVVRVEERW